MMINWPATPDKVEASVYSGLSCAPASVPIAITSKLSHTEAQGSSSNGKSQHLRRGTEPSPASTFGETVIGDSVPPTPDDVQGSTELSRALRGLQLAPGEDANPLESECVGHPSTFTTTRDGIIPDEISRESLGPLGGGHIAKLNTPSRHRYVPATSSPGGIRRRGSFRDSNWRAPRSVSFALPPSGNDPFYEEHGTPVRNGSGRAHSTTLSPSRDDVKSANSPSTDTPNSCSVFRPRGDREVVEISGENAQALFPPNSCVFVANLVQGLADEQLEYSVTRAFEQFGKVYVKIKRDPRGMPYAFCQYENSEDSEKAIEFGRGLMIDGRQCRTERAKVNRSLYLTRITGGAISEAEARDILRGRGDLEKLWVPSPTEKEMFRLGDGIWIMFAFFQDCRDAQALFKDNPKYRLEAPHHEESQNRSSVRSGPSPMSKLTPARRHCSPPHYRMHHAERCSVYVGNLPQDVTSEQLHGLLSGYGMIRSCEVISQPSAQSKSAIFEVETLVPDSGTDTSPFNVFAHVEFSREDEARRVASCEHVLKGVRLRVEQKEPSSFFMSRKFPSSSSGSPHPRRTGMSGPVSHEIAMARALAAGIDTGTVMHIFSNDYSFKHPEPRTSTNHQGPTNAMVPHMQYSGFYGPPYSQIGMSAPTSETEQNSSPIFHPSSQIQVPVGHYQYHGGVPPHYVSSFATSAAYGYQTPAGHISSAGTTFGHPENHHG